jgi:hypothetical protein
MAQEPKAHAADMKRKSRPNTGPLSYRSSDSRFIEPGYGTEIFCRVCGRMRPARFSSALTPAMHDSTALVCVKYDQHSDNLVLADHRIWQPVPGAPMDLKRRLSFTNCRLQGWKTSIEKILVIPFPMHRTIRTLQTAGLPIERRDKCK